MLCAPNPRAASRRRRCANRSTLRIRRIQHQQMMTTRALTRSVLPWKLKRLWSKKWDRSLRTRRDMGVYSQYLRRQERESWSHLPSWLQPFVYFQLYLSTLPIGNQQRQAFIGSAAHFADGQLPSFTLALARRPVQQYSTFSSTTPHRHIWRRIIFCILEKRGSNIGAARCTVTW